VTRSVEIPEGDREKEAVLAATRALAKTFATNPPVNGSKDFTIDARAALVAARPYLMPTEVEIAERVRRIFMDGGAARTHAQEAAAEIADAVMALLSTSGAAENDEAP